MAPRKAPSFWGRWGGMAFQAPSQVSLTHSSASRRSPSRFMAMDRHSAPYFRLLASTARWLRAQYRSTI